MVDAVNSSTTTAASLTGALGNNKGLGRDEFLKLLVAQLKHQDPLKPQDNAQFVAELAQFSSLEQTMGINERLDLLATQNQGLANSQVVSLVGKTATVRGNIITLDGSGTGTRINFELSGNAETSTVSIRNQSGQVVRKIELGANSAGNVSVLWDGKSDSGIVLPEGAYVISVTAKGENDAPVSVSQESSATVTAVSFDKGYPVLHLGNGVSVPVSDLLRVDSPPK